MQRGSRFFFFPTTRALSLFDLAKTTLVALPLPTPHTFALRRHSSHPSAAAAAASAAATATADASFHSH
jgi:hypothetical protein